MPAITKIQQRRGTSASWASANPVLGAGEIGFDTTLNDFKMGDGVTTWNNLGLYSSKANPAASAFPVRDWVQEMLRLTPTQAFRWIFMGDSQSNDGAYQRPTARPDIWGGQKGYSYRLANLISVTGIWAARSGDTVTTNTTPGSHVWSTAVAGTTAATYSNAGVISNVGTIQPHLVTHMVGTNDFLQQIDPAVYKTNLKNNILNVWGASANTRQLLIVCWPVKKPAGTPIYTWQMYVDKMKEIATELKSDTRFELFDYNVYHQRTGGADATNWWSSWPDGTHGLPELHRDMTERLAEWMGLPSPMATFGTTRVIMGSVPKPGNLDDLNPASSMDIYAVPVPRTVTVHIRLLGVISGEGDVKIQIIDDNLVKTIIPTHIQAANMRNYTFTYQFEIPPNQSRYVYLSGSSVFNVWAGVGYDQYNGFWAECSYI